MAGPTPGSKLDRWYRRTPAEIAAEKAKNAEAQRAAFFAPRAGDREPESAMRTTVSSVGAGAPPNRASLPRKPETPSSLHPRGAAPEAGRQDPWALAIEQRELENEMLRQYPSAAKDFVENYSDMRAARTIGGDKYFHCRANFDAARRGDFGDFAAEKLSNAREIVQQRFFGESRADAEADQQPNRWGRRQAQTNPGQSSAAACAPFRPRGLDPKY